jgi:hypothetical protein
VSNSNTLIPISDEQAKAIQEALKFLQGLGGFLKETFGTVPQDVVGLLAGDWLKVRRAENLARILVKTQERLRARRVEAPEPASLSVGLPILIAAADESRDELQDLWARLLAATADPSRAKAFRNAFIDAAKRMDPLDAAVLRCANAIHGGRITIETRIKIASELGISRDEADVSVGNLQKLELAVLTNLPDVIVSPFGREFLRAVAD